MTDYEKLQSEKILKSFGVESNDLEKGRKAAPIGTKSSDGKFEKTINGWKPVTSNKQIHKEGDASQVHETRLTKEEPQTTSSSQIEKEENVNFEKAKNLLDDFSNQVFDKLKSQKDELDQKMKDLKAEHTAMKNGIEHFKQNDLANLSKKANELGLKINNIHFNLYEDRKEGVANKINVGIDLVSNGKFKFIQDQGYDKNGINKNHNKLVEKASKVAEALKSATSATEASVNHYSLQHDDKYANKRVMLNLYY